MLKYFLIVSFLLIFMVWPGYKKYKNGEGYFDMMESLSFVILLIIACIIEYT